MEHKQQDNIYSGEYIWNIKGKQLSEMKQAKNKDEFVSDTFEMASMNWCINLYSNGDIDNNIGSFCVFLKLLSSPPQNGTKIIVFRRIYCKEYYSSYSSIGSYKKNEGYGWP
eukprot:66794_1